MRSSSIPGKAGWQEFEKTEKETRRLGAADAGRAVIREIERVRPAAKGALAEEGYDPEYGARPLKRAIQRYLENGLAEDILAVVELVDIVFWPVAVDFKVKDVEAMVLPALRHRLIPNFEAEAEGVDVTLDIWEGMLHAWQMGVPYIPEANQAINQIGAFIQKYT